MSETRRGRALRRGADVARCVLTLAVGALCAAVPGCSSKPASTTVNPDGNAAQGGSAGRGNDPNNLYDSCDLGAFSCRGETAVPCDAADPAGERDCAAQGARCQAPFGCVVCTPGEGSCQGGAARVCNAQGTAFEQFECDALQGMVCEPDGCKGACSPATLGDGYVGCDYYPTVTPNPVYSGFHFAVAVANSGDSEASVTVTRGSDTITERTVAGGQLQMIELPWISELKGGDQNACQQPPPAGATRLVPNGAYRLRSNRPVSVYQFSPLEYQLTPAPESCPLRAQCPGSPARDEGCLSFSNDASLLFPSNVLTGSYTVLSWPSTRAGQSFVSVVGTTPGTQVNVQGQGRVAPGAGISEDGSGQALIGPGDVLQIVAEAASSQSFGSDLSGTLITASAPVQVIAGNSCGFVPEATTEACDHLEQAMLPAETLGQDYLVTFPAAPASESPQVVRILPVVADTTLHFDPAPPGVADSVVRGPADGPLQLTRVMQDFRITSDKPILVAHYLQGQSSIDSGAGDPSMAIEVPRAQYRNNYIFSVSRTYDFNFVNVVAPRAATVQLDGEPLPDSAFVAIGATDYRVARYRLPADREVFRIEGSAPFGIVVYGYGAFTSYMYPGGLDLKKIAPSIIR
jgi:hypothetical protein